MNLIKPLIALLAIVNPLGIIPFFILFTANFSAEQKKRTIIVVPMAIMITQKKNDRRTYLMLRSPMSVYRSTR